MAARDQLERVADYLQRTFFLFVVAVFIIFFSNFPLSFELLKCSLLKFFVVCEKRKYVMFMVIYTVLL